MSSKQRWFRVDYGRVAHYGEVRGFERGYSRNRCYSLCGRANGQWQSAAGLEADEVRKCKECERMKAMVYLGPGELSYEEVEIPQV